MNIKKRILNEWSNLRGAYDRFQDDSGSLMAAAVAYYIGLSLFPILLVLIAGVGMVLEYSHLGQNAEQQVLKTMAEHVSPAVEQHVQRALAGVKDRSGLTAPIGLLGILLTAMAAFAQFDRAFNQIWNVPEPPGEGIVASVKRLLVERGIAFLMLLGLGLLVVIVFLLGMTMSTIEGLSADLVPVDIPVGRPVQFLITVLMNILLFTLVYRWLPRVTVRWREAFRGAIVAAIGWEVGRQLLAWLVVGQRYSNAYGVIGSFMALLLWCFFAVSVVFIGAEYIQEICEKCDQDQDEDCALKSSEAHAHASSS